MSRMVKLLALSLALAFVAVALAVVPVHGFAKRWIAIGLGCLPGINAHGLLRRKAPAPHALEARVHQP